MRKKTRVFERGEKGRVKWRQEMLEKAYGRELQPIYRTAVFQIGKALGRVSERIRKLEEESCHRLRPARKKKVVEELTRFRRLEQTYHKMLVDFEKTKYKMYYGQKQK